MYDFDFVIIGGGLVGRVMALDLARRNVNVKVAIVDFAAPKDETNKTYDNRVYAISPVNQKYLTELGVWQNIPEERVSPLNRMEINGDLAGRILFSAFEQGLNDLGNIVESDILLQAINKSLVILNNCQIFSQYQFLTYENNLSSVKVHIKSLSNIQNLTSENNIILNCSLLIGADGRESKVRKFAGLNSSEIKYQDYAAHALVANFYTEREHYGTAYQWFSQNGILAYLPLAKNMISIVWSLSENDANKYSQTDNTQLENLVAAAGNYSLGELKLVGEVVTYPLKLIQVPKIIDQNLALIGDAAHAIHPLSGHGLNLGLQDCQVLCSLLEETGYSSKLTALVKYQRMRRENVLLMQKFTDLLQRLFANKHSSLMKILRNSGMKQLDNLTIVKKQLINYALNC